MRARLVFDLDGTLIDSLPDIRAIAGRVLASEGAEPLTLEETRDFIGSGTGAFVARMRAARDLPETREPEMLHAFLELYDGAVDLTTLYPGVAEALRGLAEAGHALGICTNKPAAPTRAILDHFDLSGLFDVIVGGDSLPQRKPDPAPLATALKRMGKGPALFVGDSEIDAETAAAADVPFLLFTQGYSHVDIEEMAHAACFERHADLPGLIEATLGGGRHAGS